MNLLTQTRSDRSTVLAWPMRSLCAVLIPVYLMTALPLGVLAAEPPSPQAGTPGLIAPPKDMAKPVLTPKNVKANKKKPKFTPPSAELKFSADPQEQELRQVRVLADALVPSDKTTAAENKALAGALLAYQKRGARDDWSALGQFLQKNPASPWNAGLELNLGLQAYQTGHFTKAFEFWESAWKRGKDAGDPGAKAQADRAFGELVRMHARIGNMKELKTLLEELGNRSLTGSATELVANARAALWMMENEPGKSFRCGPYALASVLLAQNPNQPFPQLVTDSASTQKGFSLKEVEDLAGKLKMKVQAVKWEDRAGTVPPTPSVIHWKIGHYAALIREEKGLWLVRDPTFGEDLWITKEALMAEASGYFLVPEGPLSKGWANVAEAEAGSIYGKGFTTVFDVYFGGGPVCLSCAEHRELFGMAYSNAHLLWVSLHIKDTPVFYDPPKGPKISFELSYGQREDAQPSTFTYSNLGPKWTFNWLSFITDDPTATSANVSMFTKVGGSYAFKNFNNTTQKFDRQPHSQAILVRTGPASYENNFPDGSRQIFGLSDGGTGAGRRVFLTEEIDPAGNSVAYSYDVQFRLVAVTDALGQVTTLEYDHPTDDLKITKVTDPFNREVTLEYNGAGQLWKITDVVGITSEFTYGNNDFITAMTTPYGTETYAYGEVGTTRWLDMTDPQGDKQRVEFRHSAPGIPSADPAAVVPSVGFWNAYLNARNTFFWDKKAWKMFPGDYTKADITHFVHTASGAASYVIESTKKPYENRVWFTYPGQWLNYYEGTSARPAAIYRNLNAANESPVTQLTQLTYNAQGNVTEKIDPLGRSIAYVYEANGIDLKEVRQTTGSMDELLASATYNGQHLPLTVTDAAGQTTEFAYNGAGQVTQVENAKGEITAMTYDGDGYLEEIDGPASGTGDRTSYTYDGFGRIRTVTDSEGYVLTYDYDALNRVTQVTYPDTTFDQFVYNKLDAEWVKDREGRWTHHFYNSIRQKVAQQDSLGRMLNFEWCKCGALQGLTDALGRVTKWKYDAQARLIEKTYPDNTKLTYTYETGSGRLKSVADAKDQRTNYEYFVDNKLKKITYTDLAGSALSPATPAVEWTYDANYVRPTSMVDGTGTTTYSYHPIATPPVLGAGRLASIDGPVANDTIEYGYDELGRVVERSINSVAQTSEYDELGRVTEVENPLGAFVYNYLNHTGRVRSIELPNGQETTFAYFNNAGDQWLEEIKHLDAQLTPAIISKFNYTYSASGNITSWRQENSGAPSVPKKYDFRYDPVDQLLGATFKNATTSAILKESVYRYDKTGNRTSEQTDLAVTSSTSNNLNQVTSLSGGGPLEFTGTVNEPSTVTVGGNAAEVDASGNFRGTKNVSSGTSTVAVVATDASSNVTTQNYDVTVPSGTSRALTYDLNGNMTDDGNGKEYEWDAANRLVKIIYGGGGSTEFTYDGLSRRVKIVEKDISNVVTSDKRFVWVGLDVAEERNSSNVVVKRFYSQGVQVPVATTPADKLFYNKDHLGTIRELTDDMAVVRGRWDYDSYGRRSANLITSGALEADFAYTGHYFHGRSNLHVAPYRFYDADLGKWLSRDPIAERGGINLYRYVSNRAISLVDPLGLADIPAPTSPNGSPAPPPHPPRNGKSGNPNKWVPVPGKDGNQERQKWKPGEPCPPLGGQPGGQPGASWDPEQGHWDVDDGYGNRERYLPDGTLVDHDSDPIQVFPAIEVDPVTTTLVLAAGAVAFFIYSVLTGAGSR